MEIYTRLPDPLTNVGDMANNWQIWKEDFIIFMKATGYINKSNDLRADFLKNLIGKVGLDAIQNISFENPQDENNMDILIAKLEEFFLNSSKNEVVERYEFFTRSRKQNESIEQYINSLREKARTCNFKNMTDSIIRDRIILDTQDKILRKKFLETNNLDLQKIIKIYNNHKNNTDKTKQITKENKTESKNSTTGNVNKRNWKCWKCNQQHPQGKCSVMGSESNNCEFKNSTTGNVNKKTWRCWRCGQQHPQGKCSAMGSECKNCGEANHFTQCCRGPKSNTKTNNNKVNKNVLNSLQSKKIISKSTDTLWDFEADNTTETIASMSKMVSLPDIPATLQFCDSDSLSSENDSICDFIILNAINTSSKNSYYNNTVSESASSSKNTYTYLNGADKKLVIDSHKNDKTTTPTQYAAHLSRNTQYTCPNPYKTERKSIIDLYKKDETTESTQSTSYLPRTTQCTYPNAYKTEPKSVIDLRKKDEITEPTPSTSYLPSTTQYTYPNAYKTEPKSVIDLRKKDETTEPTPSTSYLPSTTQYTYSNAYKAEQKSITDLHNKDGRAASKTYNFTCIPNTGKKSNDASKKTPIILKFKQSRKKKADDNICLLS